MLWESVLSLRSLIEVIDVWSIEANEVITIIGAGSTALSFLHYYLQQIDEGIALPKTIYLIEKRSIFGPGMAYEADLPLNLLNTKTGFITPFHDKPGDFFNWLQSNKEMLVQYSHMRLDKDGYAPRPLFGLYLQRQMTSLVKAAAARMVHIIQINAECKDVHCSESDYIVTTDCNLTLRSDYVFFFCGTMLAKTSQAVSQSGMVLTSPYPVRKLPSQISPSASVGIIGARLSCIDAWLVGLMEQGHQGMIRIHSRSGYFPSVRGTQGRIIPKVLTAEKVDSLASQKGALRIKDLVDLIQMEISLVSDVEGRGEFHCHRLD